jgi:S-adenosylmethionine:tRNA ribosyltransferase-isomerase
MQLSDFDYNLPSELIANSHVEPRDHSRLFVLDRKSGEIEHKHFYDIVDYLKEGDVLVFNNSKVFKARIYGTLLRSSSFEGQVIKRELLLIKPTSDLSWEVLIRGKVNVGDKIFFKNNIICEVEEAGSDFVKKVKFNRNTKDIFDFLEKEGETPLPPYIKKSQISNLKSQNRNSKLKSYKLQANETSFYQTVYAENVGSVAAPTAGFHFTDELLGKIKKKGVECLSVTLHVGPGTFLPVKSDDITEHQMHEEFFEIKKEVWENILKAKKEGRRIVAVGTTTTRTLESAFRDNKLFGSTDIFIYPPYKFQIVDCLITNFHLPKSTLLMLVSSFANHGGIEGIAKIKKAYKEAIEKGYRFYSFGDSMFIL